MVAQAEPTTDTRTFEPRGGMLDAWYSHEPEIVLSGPAGTGKSRGSLEKIHLCLADRYPGARALMVRKVFRDLADAGMDTFEREVIHPSEGITFFGGSVRKAPHYRYPNGSTFYVGGMNDPTKVLSKAYDLIYFQQAEQGTEDDWQTLTTRLRASIMPYQQLLGDCNPGPAHHWIPRRAEEGRLRLIPTYHEDNAAYWKDGSWTPEGDRYVNGILANLTGVLRLRLYKGLWVSAEGTVYDFNEEVHLVDAPPKDADIAYYVASVDWGFTNPGVLQVWAVTKDGRMCLVREWYMTGKTVDDYWIEAAREVRAEYHPRQFSCDPTEPMNIATFSKAGIPARKAENNISVGLQKVERRLRLDLSGKPKLTIYRDALVEVDRERAKAKLPTSTREEFDSYVWPKTREGKAIKETPIKEHDHGMDTMRYAVMTVDSGTASAPTAAPRGARQASRFT